MRILLIAYDNGSHINEFPLGLGYVAAAFDVPGVKVDIYEDNIIHGGMDRLKKYLNTVHYDAVGLSACGGYWQYRKFKEILEAIQSLKHKPYFICGGHLFAPEPQYFIDLGVDCVVIREVEPVVNILIDAVAKGDRGIVGGDPAVLANVHWIPWYKFTMEHYVLKRYENCTTTDRTMDMLSGRGCLYNCSFCYRMVPGYRPRTPQDIVNEAYILKLNYRVSYINFADELLMTSNTRIYELCDALRSLRIKWRCNGRLNFAGKLALQEMKSAGCVFINYGIESMDNEVLEKMHKHLDVDTIIHGVENTLAVGISPGLNIIFGNPGDSEESLRKGVAFIKKYADGAQLRTIRPVTPYPGTELYNRAVEMGLIRDIGDFYEKIHKNSDLLTVNFTDLTDKEFYGILHSANHSLIQDYYKKKRKDSLESCEQFYDSRNENFRGFRSV